MKILHINTFDYGGAAIAAIRLHNALWSQGINSSMLFLHKTNNSLPNSYAFGGSNTKPGFLSRQYLRFRNKLLSKFTRRNINSRKLRNKTDGFEMFSFSQTDFDITTQKIYREADIIHLHWIAGFLDYRFFRKNTKPVIWTLHDMNPFTGGCHYSSGCEKYVSECKNCPQLHGTKNDDNSFLDQEYKRVFLNGKKIVITTPSEWLRQCSSNSRLFGTFKHFTIPNSLDLNVFKPQDKAFCRSVFNISTDKNIILFVSDNIENKRKGFDLLLDALPLLKRKDYHICVVGNNNINIPYQSGITFLGNISDERLMALVYSAADVFLLPSREDNLPNVMLESLSCGTPVIAFPVGGMLDVIKTGFNGILTNEITSESLSLALNEFLGGKYTFDSSKISENAKQNFLPSLQSERYKALYKRMLPSSSN